MRTSKYLKTLALSAALFTSFTTPAFAQDTDKSESAFSISGNAAITSDYRFRGVSFTNEDIAVQGGIDIGHSSGFYVGTWASSLEDSAQFGHTELDLYAGWSGNIGTNTVLDVGVLAYIYPNGTNALASDYVEPYVSLTQTIGAVEAKVGAAYAPDQKGLASDNIYIYGDLSGAIPKTPISLTAHLGYTDGSLAVGTKGHYLDWSLGAEWAITDKLSLGLAYVDTDAPNGPNVDGAAVVTLGVSF